MATNQQPAIVILDEPELARSIRHMLTTLMGAEYEVVSTSDHAEVVHLTQHRTVPVVIAEYRMRGGAPVGPALIRHVRHASPATAVIITTTAATPEVEDAVWEAGASYYLPKPYSLDLLETVIRELAATYPQRLATR